MLAIRSLVLSLTVAALAIAGAVAEEPMASQLAVGVATHAQLNDATALANKNAVVRANNVAVTRSNLRMQQDDVVTDHEQEQTLVVGRGATDDTGAQPSDVPAGLVLTGEDEPLPTDTEGDGGEPAADHDALALPDVKEGDAEDQGGELETFAGRRRRFFYPGFRGGYRGWRYPLPYWRRHGRRFHGGRCAFGRVYGNLFYC